MKQAFALLIVSLCLALSGAAWAAPVRITGDVSADMQHLTRQVPPPKTDNKDVIAAEIDIRYPVLVSTGKADAAVPDAINKAIRERLLAIVGETPAPSVEKMVDQFAADYAASVRETPEMPGAWSLKFDTEIRYADEDLLSLWTLDSVFTGGAHPNSNFIYMVFSMKTGKPVELSSLIAKDKAAELTAIAERHFRRVRELKPDETYEQAGFQFERNTFALNTNFLVSKEGLAFCFNPYEIAPYAMGVTELVIPWSDLKDVIDPDGPAARFLTDTK
ncbi:MAG TPA: DUF3298 and DUF4163 domain-containing protein [Candidatus Ozemobacteraceae bacterium]|mgnify:CR=1 FL=1|nr:DUF3298 and DUF4163 domain-containing protein [Candidatus Ozemobacteraceae bacterium]HQG28205.1 DUF3298 and DUF4163 domain-containing protein [Candidatus Ozemobacteraceae bacterium]